jgi:IMP dehydrogenase
MRHDAFVEKVYREMYPWMYGMQGLVQPRIGLTLREVRVKPIYSEVDPNAADLSFGIGPIELKVSLLGAAMDDVSGARLAAVLPETGPAAVIYRDKKPEKQLKMVREALAHKMCLVRKPRCLRPDQTIEDVRDIHNESGFGTIPVVTDKNVLVGVIFTRDIAYSDRLSDPVRKWMKPLSDLKVESSRASFAKIRSRLLNEQQCSVLPIINKAGQLKGIYFMKDFFVVNPSIHNKKPLVGMAVGVHESDLERVKEGLRMGVGIFVIDSSHGNCPPVINQARKVVQLVGDKAAVIAGNIADIDGYYRLALVGVHAVKGGIGSGSICTTSKVTGAGVPMFKLLQELSFIRKRMAEEGMPTPAIIADGSINGPGDYVVAIAAGADACMAGRWLASAQESLSYQTHGARDGFIRYRGMASEGAIRDRLSDRYGIQKSAAEGVEHVVPYRGPLKSWIGKDLELIRGGFAHCGARNIQELHEYGNWPFAFELFSGAGAGQITA